ncbi:unnamed protein product [Closterium sp. NIES-54]
MEPSMLRWQGIFYPLSRGFGRDAPAWQRMTTSLGRTTGYASALAAGPNFKPATGSEVTTRRQVSFLGSVTAQGARGDGGRARGGGGSSRGGRSGGWGRGGRNGGERMGVYEQWSRGMSKRRAKVVGGRGEGEGGMGEDAEEGKAGREGKEGKEGREGNEGREGMAEGEENPDEEGGRRWWQRGDKYVRGERNLREEGGVVGERTLRGGRDVRGERGEGRGREGKRNLQGEGDVQGKRAEGRGINEEERMYKGRDYTEGDSRRRDYKEGDPGRRDYKGEGYGRRDFSERVQQERGYDRRSGFSGRGSRGGVEGGYDERSGYSSRGGFEGEGRMDRNRGMGGQEGISGGRGDMDGGRGDGEERGGYDEAEAFFEARGVAGFKLHTADVVEWRCRAKLAVRGTAEEPLVGLYAARSHDVVDIPMCRGAVRWSELLITWLSAHGSYLLPLQHPLAHYSLLHHTPCFMAMPQHLPTALHSPAPIHTMQLALTTNDTSIPSSERYLKGKVQVTLVWNASNEKSPAAEKIPALCKELWRQGGKEANLLHSVWVNFQTSSSNVIFGGRWRHMIGPTDMWERLGGVDVCFTPGSFGQANYKAFDLMLKHLHSLIPRRSSVVELYAGAGAIGLSLAATTQCSVRCYEINEAARAPFTRSLERLQPLLRHPAAVSWHQADAEAPVESHLDILLDADVVLVDPPRRGLHEPVLAALLHAARHAGR